MNKLVEDLNSEEGFLAMDISQNDMAKVTLLCTCPTSHPRPPDCDLSVACSFHPHSNVPSSMRALWQDHARYLAGGRRKAAQQSDTEVLTAP